MINARDALVRTYIRDAIVQVDHEVIGKGPQRGRATEWHIHRTIWRCEDVHVYRVAVPEEIRAAFQNRNVYEYIRTRSITYVPTGRIVYDNSLPEPEAVLFEYRLKEARDLRKS